MSSIKPAKLADAVADHIQQLILEGALQPGERLLSDRELSAKLDVSRPSLRGALDKLVCLGLLNTDAQGVCYVSESIGKTFRDPLALLMENPEGRLDFMEFRLVVEASATAFAAERGSEVDRKAIRAQFARMEAAHKKNDTDELAKADADFHFAIYAASHNVMMLQIMRSLEGVLRSNVHLNRKNHYEYRGERESLLAEHCAIYEAVVAQDPERASEAARLHMVSNLRTQSEMHDAERRLETSIRRLGGSDFIAPKKKRSR